MRDDASRTARDSYEITQLAMTGRLNMIDVIHNTQEGIEGGTWIMMTSDTQGASGDDKAQTQPQLHHGEISQILSTISHELKNPLASLTLNAQMISRAIERGRNPRIESAQLLMQAVGQLDQIASELSDAVRAESDRFALALKPVDIAALARRAAAEAEAAYHRPITVEAPTRPLMAQADETRVRQVIGQTLINAVRYTPSERAITLWVGTDGERIRVETRDEGPGVAAHDMPYLFDAFYRGATDSQPHTAAGSGLGLGLYIARCIVQRHGGDIGVVSAAGKGCVIWFTLPRATRS